MKNKKLSEKQFKERFYALLENVKTGYGLNGSFVKPFRTTENSLDDLEATEKCFGAHDGEYSKEEGFNERIDSLIELFENRDYFLAIQEAKEIKKFIGKQEKELGRCVVENISQYFTNMQNMIRKYVKHDKKLSS